jgi:hypothetical protein
MMMNSMSSLMYQSLLYIVTCIKWLVRVVPISVFLITSWIVPIIASPDGLVVGTMPFTTFIVVLLSALTVEATLNPFIKYKQPNRLATTTRPRKRRTVMSVFEEIGPIGVKRAYRMSPESFWKLHKMIRPYMEHRKGNPKKRKRNRSGPNGLIDSSVRLAVTLRYLSGGSHYDLCPLYGISNASADMSVKYVVDAINKCPSFSNRFAILIIVSSFLSNHRWTTTTIGLGCVIYLLQRTLLDFNSKIIDHQPKE